MQNSGQDYSSYEYVSRMGPCNFYSISQNCMVNFDNKNVSSKTIFQYKESDNEITILKRLPVYEMR